MQTSPFILNLQSIRACTGITFVAVLTWNNFIGSIIRNCLKRPWRTGRNSLFAKTPYLLGPTDNAHLGKYGKWDALKIRQLNNFMRPEDPVSVLDTLFVNDFETHNTDELIGTVNWICLIEIVLKCPNRHSHNCFPGLEYPSFTRVVFSLLLEALHVQFVSLCI